MQKYFYLLLGSLLYLPALLFAQGTQVEFGKNRVQFHEDFAEWSQYESPNFIAYWYGEGRNVGQAAVQLAEYDFAEIQNILEHRMNDKIEIVIYTDVTDLKQSNIGSEEAFANTTGQTKIVGNKMFVFFDGNHNNLRRDVREGIATVYINQMLFGSNLQEIVQNAVMMNLPEWFKQGLVGYVGEEWSTEIDNRMRDIMLSGTYDNFDAFAEAEPKLAGHSLWHYISQSFGNSTVSNLLYLTRINRSIESGFLYVLGSTYQRTVDGWAIFYRERYKNEVKAMNTPSGEALEVKNKRELPLTRLKISPNGQKIVYVSNEIGKYKIYLQDVNTGEREVIMKGGFRNAFQATDYNYPLVSWNPSGQEIAIVYEKRDIPKLTLFDVGTKSTTTEDLGTQYQRVYSMDYTNPVTLVFSGTVRGYSDIFLYYIKTRQTQRITSDFWDDLDARFVKIGNQKGVLFSSNRPDTLLEREKLDSILPVNTFDIFYYDLENKSKELVRVTNTPFANEWQPMAVDTTWFSYLSDESGINNRNSGYLEDYVAFYEKVIELNDGDNIILHPDSTLTGLDSTAIDTIFIRPVIKKRAITHTNTNYQRNIISQSSAPRAGKLVESVYDNGLHRFYVHSLEPENRATPPDTYFRRSKLLRKRQEISDNLESPFTIKPKEDETSNSPNEDVVIEEPTIPAVDTSETIDIDNYFFQTDFDEEETPAEVTIDEDDGELLLERPTPPTPVGNVDAVASTENSNGKKVHDFRPGRIVPYRTTFRTDYVTTNLDNSLLFGGLDSYAGTPQGFSPPPPGILLKMNVKDLFEDYQLEGGIRIPTTFNGAEYFLIFDDRKKRLDKQIAVYMRNRRNVTAGGFLTQNREEEQTILGQYSVRYPLDIFTSIRATGTLRQDRLVQLATDANTLNQPFINEQRAGVKLEYVFDNTLDVSINIKNGTRYKIFTEVVKKFNVEVFDEFKFDFNEGILGIVGFDARHYQRLDKHSILAVRAAGATSFGTEKILYYLGGVDNWLFPSFNEEIPQPVGGNFAFQTLATNLRGFRQNIRNGNSYALVNAELRVPIFRYIFKRTRSNFFRNFQAVGFFDVGTAWQGPTPFTDENPLNTTFIENEGSPVRVKVNYFRDPVVAGYGAGIRTTLFGYFIRLDYAWGIETRQIVRDQRLYISLGTDF
ncbi:MAG: BamA/TamA family outer membrane protein [Saprospiraceae bacterium]